MSEIRWAPNWYVTRLHATTNGINAACGAYVDEGRGKGGWRARRLEKDPPKCAHCLRKLDGSAYPSEQPIPEAQGGE